MSLNSATYGGHVEAYEGEDYYATRSATCAGCAFAQLQHCISVPCETDDEDNKTGFIYVTKINFITRRLTK